MAVTHTGSDGNQYSTVYMHLSRILVYSGTVTQGQPIAISGGSSGGSEAGVHPHLHFHIWAGYGSRDSHTIPIEALFLQRSGSDATFRQYDARTGDLDDTRIGGATFQSNCDCGSGNSISFRTNGGPPIHPASTLVKTATSGTVYLLRGPDANVGAIYRSGVANLAALHNPYNQISDGDQLVQANIITIADDEMNQYTLNGVITSPKQLSGNGLTIPDGSLILNTVNGEVSLVSNGRRRPFVSSDVFLGLGYKYCNVFANASYSSYPAGDPITGSTTAASSGSELIQNGGFRNGTANWSTPDWGNNPSPWLITTNTHNGYAALCLGNSLSSSEASGVSGIYQWVTIPPNLGSVSLSFWYLPWSSDVSTAYDGQEVRLFDAQGNYMTTPMQVLETDGVWKTKAIDLSAYQGQKIAVMFDVYQDGAGDPTGMCIDDVSIKGGGSPSGQPTANVQITFSPNPVSLNTNDNRWYYTVTLREMSGVPVTLTGLSIGGTDYSSSIGSWFGSTRLAASGQLGTPMWASGYNSPFDLVWQISGTDDNGHTLSWRASVHLQ